MFRRRPSKFRPSPALQAALFPDGKHSMISCPSMPIDLFFTKRFKPLSHCVVFDEYDQVVTSPPRGRCNQPIKSEECERRPDFLSSAIIAFAIPVHVHAQCHEISAAQTQCP